MLNPFNQELVNEWINSTGLSDSTKRTYGAAVCRYGKCWEECGHETASAWGLYADTRKHSKSPRPSNILIREGKRCLTMYLSWLNVHYPDIRKLYETAEVSISRQCVNKPADIDFEDIELWLKQQVGQLSDFRQAAVERIVLFADNPESAEFKVSVSDVQSLDRSKKRYEDLITLVKIFKEI